MAIGDTLPCLLIKLGPDTNDVFMVFVALYIGVVDVVLLVVRTGGGRVVDTELVGIVGEWCLLAAEMQSVIRQKLALKPISRIQPLFSRNRWGYWAK